MNYECGAEPIGSAWVQFPVGFYLVRSCSSSSTRSRVPVPVGVVLRARAWRLLGDGGVRGHPRLGWLYAYREGVLEWK